jgi:drug/metabolite transporter (DMT)-like permease
MKNKKLKGTLLIAAAACCYGMLGTFVKMAYRDGFTIAEITISQFTLGFGSLLLFNLPGRKQRKKRGIKQTSWVGSLEMIAAGTSLGLTSIFYYMAVKYIPVSLAIVLLLQTVWMSIILEAVLGKRRPGMPQIFCAIAMLIGTVLATGVLVQTDQINWVGIGWGLSAAASYTATMYSSNNVQLEIPPFKRSLLMISGGLIIIIIAFLPALIDGISPRIFVSWGLLLAVFGTILPPILFTKGMPLTGIALGAMLSSLEVPVSIIFAHIFLEESITLVQWLGVSCILLAVIVISSPKDQTA